MRSRLVPLRAFHHAGTEGTDHKGNSGNDLQSQSGSTLYYQPPKAYFVFKFFARRGMAHVVPR
jgi:hypothetical protein